MGKFFRILFIAAVALFALVASWHSLTPAATTETAVNLPKELSTPFEPVIKGSDSNVSDGSIHDNAEIYQYDQPGSVVTIYLTVRQGNPSDKTDHTWAEINDVTRWLYEDPSNADIEKTEAIVQIGDESGPLPGELGYGEVVPNATIQIRGSLTSMAPQNSYHIAINQGAGRWRGQSTIILNKHISDPSRVRNKLNFDLLKSIPNMVSVRTQFIHLYVQDQTVNTDETGFIDYGLYTQAELPDKKFLKNHLLDSNGQLYKAIDFEFKRYPEVIGMVDDPQFDEKAFSTVLEIKGNKDNTKLIQMLEDLNNPEIPIETTFETYFNPDNYFTWLAYNILVGNVDTTNQNFYLYSPRNSNIFYFIPWDYDNSFLRLERESCCEPTFYSAYQQGVSNYWDTTLANRVLRVPAYRTMLDEKVNQLRDFLSPERIENLLSEYKPAAEQYALQMPDVEYLPATSTGMHQDFEAIPLEIENNYKLYEESLETPMPFHLGVVAATNGSLTFSWEAAYDFNTQQIDYQLQIARDPAFDEVAYTVTLTDVTTASVSSLEPGEYFWRIIATNESGKSQLAYEHLYDASGIFRPGVKRFYLLPDGQVAEQRIED